MGEYLAQEQSLAVTQDPVWEKISDLRVDVAKLTGALEVTNQRVNNTNDNLKSLINTLNDQNKNSQKTRRWMIGIFVTTLLSLAAILGRFW